METTCNGHVLLVDDDRKLVEAYGRILRREGYAVYQASGGKMAHAALRAHDFNMVLSDVAMPDADGLAVLRTAQEGDPDLPVVLMTGGPSLQIAIEARKLGARGYLMKPINGDLLRATVAEGVSAHRAARTYVRMPRILLIERDPEMRETLTRELSAKHTVCATGSAREAILWIARGDIFESILCSPHGCGVSPEAFREVIAHQAPELAERIVFLFEDDKTSHGRGIYGHTTVNFAAVR